jgi:hypothetical protein
VAQSVQRTRHTQTATRRDISGEPTGAAVQELEIGSALPMNTLGPLVVRRISLLSVARRESNVSCHPLPLHMRRGDQEESGECKSTGLSKGNTLKSLPV